MAFCFPACFKYATCDSWQFTRNSSASHVAAMVRVNWLSFAALTDAVEQMVTAKCGQLTKRDRGTLQRRIVKALGQFIQGVTQMERKRRPTRLI